MEGDAEWKCANCEGETALGHGAADRQCPHFLTLLTRLHARLPETKYKFFPTDDPHSWKLVDQAETYTNDQDAAWQQGGNWSGGWTQARTDGDRNAPGRRGGTDTWQEAPNEGQRSEAAAEKAEAWRTVPQAARGRAGRGGAGRARGGTWRGAGEQVADDGWLTKNNNNGGNTGIPGYFSRLHKAGEGTAANTRTTWGDSPMIEEEPMDPPRRQRSSSAPQGVRAGSVPGNDHNGPTL